MIWLTWRQHRTEAFILAIVLVLITVVLIISGLNIAAATNNAGDMSCASSKCVSASMGMFNYVTNDAFGSYTFFMIFQLALLALPVCIGMFVGVPAITRELEQGTYHLAWTQSISWVRWLLIKVGGITVYAFCVSLIIYILFLWWKVPVLATFSPYGQSDNNLLFPFNQWYYQNYDMWGIPAIAYTLFALLLGLCLGTILKKTVPAIGVTLVLFVVVRILIEVFWRPYFLPPLVLTTPAYTQTRPSITAWRITNYEIDKTGKKIDPVNGQENGYTIAYSDICAKTYPDFIDGVIPFPAGDVVRSSYVTEQKEYLQCVATHGFKKVYVYQPVDRVLLFQEIESGIYLLLSALLLALTLWCTKHRIIGARK